MQKSQKKILCVDDDFDDRLFLTEAIGDVTTEVIVIGAENGVEAMNYLNRAKDSGEGLPCLIVLDINMPMLDGKETLDRIKSDPHLENIPIVVLTNSKNPRDKTHFANRGVQLVVKPDNVAFMEKIAVDLLTYC